MGFYQAEKIEKLEAVASDYRKALARIAALEAEILAGNDWLNARAAVLQELAEANARIAALEAALKPFADAAHFKITRSTGTVAEQTVWEICVTEANLRAARAAVEGKDDLER